MKDQMIHTVLEHDRLTNDILSTISFRDTKQALEYYHKRVKWQAHNINSGVVSIVMATRSMDEGE
jgi:hypothetical protein